MRHYFPAPVAPLPTRVRAPPSLSQLVPPPGLALACPATAPRTLDSAVSGSDDVAQRAQQDGAATLGCLTDNDVQRDHGPR